MFALRFRYPNKTEKYFIERNINMKKALSIFLVLLLVCSFVGTAFAANEGSIEIKKAAVKEVSEGVYEAASDFAAYQMLELDSYDKDEGRYNYVVLPGWDPLKVRQSRLETSLGLLLNHEYGAGT